MSRWRRRSTIGWLILLLFLAGLGYYGYQQKWLEHLRPARRSGSELFRQLPSQESPATGGSKVVLHESIRRIETYYQDYRDNTVRYEINLLRQTALPSAYRNWLNLLEPLLRAPEIHTLKDNFSYHEVAATPQLYRDCYILWRGRVTNIIKLAEAVGFDLLVDYIDGTTLSGQVTVWVDTATTLASEQLIEVFARVQPNQNTFYLEAVTLRRLGAPE